MAAAAIRREDEAERLYAYLMAAAAGDGNHHVVASLYATWATGGGALPDWLGLTPATLREMLTELFPTTRLGRVPNPGRPPPPGRDDEVEDLVHLLLAHRAGVSPTEVGLARIVAVACLGDDHLWQDLGLWSRADLSELMQRNFPALAARNVRDMKWKRFLYKQLCETEGLRVCRAPSCDACGDHHVCFGPEE
ncbi:nitrogen fixation protein NifQ [Thioalkalicoccus limnaeus]|uniref:Nitrogen fixation protein NifQ n=1 Tax=Thioalkalicoccus limnaeus TaxID=120681 RepID=A0ABV4BFH9_9GAMM